MTGAWNASEQLGSLFQTRRAGLWDQQAIRYHSDQSEKPPGKTAAKTSSSKNRLHLAEREHRNTGFGALRFVTCCVISSCIFYRPSCFTANAHLKLAANTRSPLITRSLPDSCCLSPQSSYHITADLFSYKWLSRAQGAPHS